MKHPTSPTLLVISVVVSCWSCTCAQFCFWWFFTLHFVMLVAQAHPTMMKHLPSMTVGTGV